jgi:hypothetical protein
MSLSPADSQNPAYAIQIPRQVPYKAPYRGPQSRRSIAFAGAFCTTRHRYRHVAYRGVSFSQVVRLIAGISLVGKIVDFTIKLVAQHSFLITSFSRHTLSRPSFGGTTLSTATEVDYDHVDATRTKNAKPWVPRLLQRRSKPLISDSESSSDDDGRSSTRNRADSQT